MKKCKWLTIILACILLFQMISGTYLTAYANGEAGTFSWAEPVMVEEMEEEPSGYDEEADQPEWHETEDDIEEYETADGEHEDDDLYADYISDDDEDEEDYTEPEEITEEEETAEAELSADVSYEFFTEQDENILQGEEDFLGVKISVRIKNESEKADASDIAVVSVLGSHLTGYRKSESAGETAGLQYIADIEDEQSISSLPEQCHLSELDAYTDEELIPYGSAVIWSGQSIPAGSEKTYSFFAKVEQGIVEKIYMPAMFFADGERIADQPQESTWYNTELLAANTIPEKEPELEEAAEETEVTETAAAVSTAEETTAAESAEEETPVAESETEIPEINTGAESEADPVEIESIVESAAESIAEPVPETEIESTDKSIVEPTAESIAEPVMEQESEIESIVEPIAESVAEQVSEPEAEIESRVESIAEPVMEPESEVESIVESIAEPVLEPESEAESIVESIAEPVLEELVLKAVAGDGTVITMTASPDAFPYPADELTLRVTSLSADYSESTDSSESGAEAEAPADSADFSAAAAAGTVVTGSDGTEAYSSDELYDTDTVDMLEGMVGDVKEALDEKLEESGSKTTHLSLYDIDVVHEGEEVSPEADEEISLLFENDEKTATSGVVYQLIAVDTATSDPVTISEHTESTEIDDTDLEPVYGLAEVAANAVVEPWQFNQQTIQKSDTVDNIAKGITINLFDYDGGGMNLEDQNNVIENAYYNRNYQYYRGINGFGQKNANDLLFLAAGTYTGGQYRYNLNYYTGGAENTSTPVARAYQGIVRRLREQADDGNYYPVLSSTGRNMDYLFKTTNFGGARTAYANTNYLLQEDENGYYYFNSDKNYARLNEGSKEFTLYQDTYPNDENDSLNRAIGFFPFNNPNPWNRYVTPYHDSNTGYYNHHFGMTMEANFLLAPNGIYKGKPMEFEFSGDDDVWVFIDDVLVLDIGGIHQKVSGSINFNSGVVTVSDVQNSGNGVIGKTNTIDQIFRDAGKAYDNSPYSEHKISFYYLERGGCY
ncbi:MAG: fibro-slime domain-containing protein, partial [Lachnospiraceae bacterium]|nr:fibro-slime domain-containing protein [Lachnospiraceae bacterium]